MSQKTTLEKMEKGKKITDGKIKIILRKIIHPILIIAAGTKVSYKVTKENKYVSQKDKPIIFVVKHQCFQDTPIVCRVLNHHGYILSGKQHLKKIDELFFYLNGSIFVDRKDKKDMALSKNAMIEYLKKNQNIIMFPEGTWDMTDQGLMLNLKWGIIEVAKETNAQIIPVDLNYDRENKICRIKFGESMFFDKSTDKKEAIELVRDTMATMRWNSIDDKIIYLREKMDVEKIREEKRQVIAEYPKLDEEYEKSVVFNPMPLSENVFAPIKKLGIQKKTAFMFGKNKKGNW